MVNPDLRHKHSCQTPLVKLIDQRMKCIDQGDLANTLFIDFRKAFDVVDHTLLLKKLSFYKFSESQAIPVLVYKQNAANKGYQNFLKRHRECLRDLY